MFDTQLPMLFSDAPPSAAAAISAPALKRGLDRERLRQENPERYQALMRKEARRKKRQPFKTYLCARARIRGRKRGLASTITPSDLVWPTHCPVLGLKLDYPERAGMRGTMATQPNWPSLDRWDSSKGYVPGNVFVISFRANTLKSSATYEEILRVAKYLSRRPR